jgi:hypothetical protein
VWWCCEFFFVVLNFEAYSSNCIFFQCKVTQLYKIIVELEKYCFVVKGITTSVFPDVELALSIYFPEVVKVNDQQFFRLITSELKVIFLNINCKTLKLNRRDRNSRGSQFGAFLHCDRGPGRPTEAGVSTKSGCLV